MTGTDSEISRLHGGAMVAEGRWVGQGEAGSGLLRLIAQARVGKFWAISRGLASGQRAGLLGRPPSRLHAPLVEIHLRSCTHQFACRIRRQSRILHTGVAVLFEVG